MRTTWRSRVGVVVSVVLLAGALLYATIGVSLLTEGLLRSSAYCLACALIVSSVTLLNLRLARKVAHTPPVDGCPL